jgi:succinoglycan biosynthesis transport protein ExoP
VIASGPRSANPTELLSGRRLSQLLAWAESEYDQILIDSPPAMVSDTAIIGRLVDGVLLTVQPDKNRRRVVIRAVESFSALAINVLGIVANRLSPERSGDYYSYGSGYGYESDDEPLPSSERGARVSDLQTSIETQATI